MPKKPTTPPPTPINVDLNPDHSPIYYTDNIFIHANKFGIILDVCQSVGPQRLKIITRIGMSRDHAKKFIEEFGRTLAMTAEDNKVKL